MKRAKPWMIICATISILALGFLFWTQTTTNQVITKENNISTANQRIAIENNKKAKKAQKQEKVRVKTITTERVLKAKQSINSAMKDLLIGQLQIRSVNIKLPIFSGMSDAALSNGVGTYDTTRKMGEGNFVMLAHNLPAQYKDALLEPMINVKLNDTITINNYQTTYYYKVIYKDVVDQSHVELIGQTEEPIVTLIRCFGPSGTRKRLVVQAKIYKIKTNIPPLKYKTKDTVAKQTLSTSEKVALKSSSALALTGNYQKDFLQFILAAIPLTVAIIGFSLHKQK